MKQKKQASYRPRRRYGTTIVPLVTLTVLVAIISATLAGVWQLLDSTPYVTAEAIEAATAPRVTSTQQVEPAPPPKPAAESLPESGVPVDPEDEINSYQADKTEWVSTDYFDDAVFIGDSLTDGIKGYGVMSNANVISYTGINIYNIFTKQVVKSGDSKITMMEAIRAETPGKIYLMMGANGGMSLPKEEFVKGYAAVVDALIEMHPDAVLYIQPILPVTAEYAAENPDYDNARIDAYNVELRRVAKARGLPFANVAEALKDDNGALPTEASPKDGMHFGKSYYQKWFDYLREHTVAK